MKKIGVFDSGIGGMTVLNKMLEILPNEDYIYYADSKNNPYGELPIDVLNNITNNIVKYLLDNDAKIIVVACNTATTRCIKYLRDQYPDVTFVGIEPAIKVACDKDYNNILVLATPGTCESMRTKELIDENKKDKQNIYLVPCYSLANAIENNNKNIIRKVVKEIYQVYKDKKIDCIVLGCTHYPLIKDVISEYFVDVPMVDGSLGVAKRVKYLLEKDNNLNSDGTGDVLVINSNDF